MSKSHAEEIIAVLWVISSVLGFGFGYMMWGWTFAFMGATSTIASIGYAVKEVGRERRGA
ncbi:hypothetical protein F6V30_14090 [Oryzomonas sagensis]|uniref:Uncharacterized protein n=1 Tax=Oryzomonas sagensis TaxID=2603857 RepID=A0ABQ6TL20_9BACT|nr:hypothetical protein [Oryzomonas sagensis]KAB0668964.1 hypothetical protein F6V30_14090 [Oryzomonas sagensis]